MVHLDYKTLWKYMNSLLGNLKNMKTVYTNSKPPENFEHKCIWLKICLRYNYFLFSECIYGYSTSFQKELDLLKCMKIVL